MSEDIAGIEWSEGYYPKIKNHFNEENVIEVATYHLKREIDAIAIAHEKNDKSKIENLIKNGFEFAKKLLETKSIINASVKNSPRIKNTYERLYPNFDNYFEKFTAILLEDLGKNLLSHIVNGETKLNPEIKRVIQKNAVALRDLILEFQSQSPLNNNGVTYNEAMKFCQKAIKDSGASNSLLKFIAQITNYK